MYTSSVLGQYSRADKVKGMVTSNVSMVMQKVSYPVLASIQDEGERQVKVYRKVLKTTVLISFTAVFGLWAVAGPFTLTLFGEKWLPSVHYLKILCFSGVFLPLMICSANVINADGRSDITLLLEILKTVLGLVPVVFGIFFDIDALLWSMVAVSALLYLVHAYFVSRVIRYSVGRQLRDILPIFLISVFMALAVNLMNSLDIHYVLLLFLQIAAGGAITVLIYEFVYRSEEYRDIRNEIIRIIRRRK